MLDDTRPQGHRNIYIDPELVREAGLRIEAANTVMSAARMDDAEDWIVLALEHAIVLNDQALRFLEAAAA